MQPPHGGVAGATLLGRPQLLQGDAVHRKAGPVSVAAVAWRDG